MHIDHYKILGEKARRRDLNHSLRVSLYNLHVMSSLQRREETALIAQVKRDYHDLFNQYAPIWVKEEAERGSLWTSFLLSFVPEAVRCRRP